MEALAKGRGWLMDRAKLQKLKEMTKVPAVRDEADRYLPQWAEQPLTLSVGRDWFSVGHYTSGAVVGVLCLFITSASLRTLDTLSSIIYTVVMPFAAITIAFLFYDLRQRESGAAPETP